MTNQDHLLFANTAQVLDQGGDVGNIVRKTGEAEATEGTLQSELEDGKVELRAAFQSLGNGPRIWHRVRAVSQSASVIIK